MSRGEWGHTLICAIHCQTSNMDVFANNINDLKLFTIFCERSFILDFLQVSEIVSGILFIAFDFKLFSRN